MSKMNVLMMGVLVAATVVADDGKDYRPALLGTGVKIHAIRYRRIPPNAGLEEFVR